MVSGLIKRGFQDSNAVSKTERKHGATAEAGAHILNLCAVSERCGLSSIFLPVPMSASDE